MRSTLNMLPVREKERARERSWLGRIWTSQPRNSRPSLDSDLVLMFFFSPIQICCVATPRFSFTHKPHVFLNARQHTHTRQAHTERHIMLNQVFMHSYSRSNQTFLPFPTFSYVQISFACISLSSLRTKDVIKVYLLSLNM